MGGSKFLLTGWGWSPWLIIPKLKLAVVEGCLYFHVSFLNMPVRYLQEVRHMRADKCPKYYHFIIMQGWILSQETHNITSIMSLLFIILCWQKLGPHANVGFSKAMSAGWLLLNKNAEGGPRVTRKVRIKCLKHFRLILFFTFIKYTLNQHCTRIIPSVFHLNFICI